jgi:citronellol/citronellal dehydrogenase
VPSAIFRDDLLAGKVAIVTGGGSGLGRVTALELASLGARVAICGRRPEPLARTAALAERSGTVTFATCDVREEDEVAAFVDRVLEDHGRIDVLVNNAGGQFLAPAEAITPKGFRTVIRLNVEGTWLMSHAVATKAMIPAASGKILTITLTPHQGLPGMAHSAAARAAQESLMRTLATEWARFGITTCAIAAGHFGTETFMTKYPQPIVEMLSETIPIGRLGRPEEVAWLIAYLASPAADFITGSVISIDGGRDNWFGRWPPSGAAGEDGVPLAEARRPDARSPSLRPPGAESPSLRPSGAGSPSLRSPGAGSPDLGSDDPAPIEERPAEDQT